MSLNDMSSEQPELNSLPADLNNMPAEMIAEIFWQLASDIHDVGNFNGRPVTTTTTSQLTRMATVSKHVSECFQDSQFSIFCRLVLLTLATSIKRASRPKDPSLMLGHIGRYAPWTKYDPYTLPAFADMVIKIGSLRVMDNRPTDPDEIKSIIEAVQRDHERSLTGEDFAPERFFGGAMIRGCDVTTVRHPFDVLYPLTTTYLHEETRMQVVESQRPEYYIRQLLREVALWTRHLATPWTSRGPPVSDENGAPLVSALVMSLLDAAW
ncbi:hypothetical protein GE09DRAFT_1215951 [Coniochaeta sp. 2T2.1]|nr:hypothetical protein GE09DRAFT_1215951 [Coniochaeta sp. 2T2.1]